MAKNMNIYMSGVGGQGIGVLSEVMIQACLAAGHNVKGVDTHGLAQRGGVVVSHLRLGEKLFTPRITPGSADIVIALERLEALRGTVNFMKDGGTLVYYDMQMQPIHVRMNKASYPENSGVETAVSQRKGRVERVLVEGLPDPRMQNTALLGRIAALELIDGVDRETMLAAIKQVIPARALEQNLAVFEQGSAG